MTLDISNSIAPHVPLLRRFARALTGSQRSGDGYAAAALEAIIEDDSVFNRDISPRVALYRVFYAIWSSSGAHIEGNDDGETDLAQVAHRRLRQLMPDTRVAILLNSLEGFRQSDTAAIMQISEPEVDGLLDAGLAEMQDQVAGRVLIIEDEPIIAMDLQDIVTGQGHEVVAVTDTKDSAVAAASEKKPELILADIQLADGSSGIDAVNEILADFEVPVIFVTAYPERLLTGERPEPTFLITKPFTEEQVTTAVAQALFFEKILPNS